MPTKLNSAGKQQPYVPAGYGDASGEYAEHETGSNKHYADASDTSKQLPYNDKEKSYIEVRNDVLKEQNNENLIKQVLDLHKYNDEEKEKIRNIINSANQDCLHDISNLDDVHLEDTKQTAYFRFLGNKIAISKKSMLNEYNADGDTYFHEYGHAINHNSKLSGYKEEVVKYKNEKFTTTQRHPASSFYISEKYHKSLQDMLIEEYKNNVDALKIKKEIEKEIEENTYSKLIDKVGKNNYDNFLKERNKLNNKKEEQEKVFDKQLKEKLDLLYSNKITYEQFKPIKKEILDNKYIMQEEINQEIKQINNKYKDVLNKKLEIAKEIKKEINIKYSNLSDVVDGANKGSFNLTGAGHPRGYWGKLSYSRGDEFFAEAFSSKATNIKGYEIFKKYFPKTMDIFEEILERSR